MDIKTMLAQPGLSGFDVVVKIKKIFNYSQGTGEFGPYSFQNMIVSDATGEIAVVVKNHPQIPGTAEGKIMSVKCKSFGGELKGTSIKTETYQDDNDETKSQVKLIITKSAQIEVADTVTAGGASNQHQPLVSGKGDISTESLVACFLEAEKVLNDPQVVAVKASLEAKGWGSEDLRAVALTFAIQRSRK